MSTENRVRISTTAFRADVNNGLKRDELITKYSTPEVKLVDSDITKLLKATGLKIRKTRKAKFELIDDDYITIPLVMNNNIAKDIKEKAEAGNVDYTSYENTQESTTNN